jgi:hypothetical protein
MSLGIAIKSPERIVLAVESRISVVYIAENGDRQLLTFDSANKFITFNNHNYVGAIDVATITRSEGLTFVQRKSIVGEPQLRRGNYA